MATQNLNVGYFIQGDVGSSAQNAHGQASGTANSTGGGQPNAIQYYQSSGRGGGTFRYSRTFLNFDTSGITATTGAVTLSIPGVTNADAKVYAVKSTHSTPILASGDDFNNIDVNTLYSSLTTWGTSTNTITLNATAIAQIENENDFDVAEIRKILHETDKAILFLMKKDNVSIWVPKAWIKKRGKTFFAVSLGI